MATRFIHQDIAVGSVGREIAGFGVDTDGVLRIARSSAFKGSLASDPAGEPIPVRRIISGKTASFSLSAADSGAVVALNSTSITVTLPDAAAGLEYKFVVAGVATAGVGYTIAPASGDKFYFQEATANSSLRVLSASDSTGDFVNLFGTSDGWLVEAYTQTSGGSGLNLI